MCHELVSQECGVFVDDLHLFLHLLVTCVALNKVIRTGMGMDFCFTEPTNLNYENFNSKRCH